MSGLRPRLASHSLSWRLGSSLVTGLTSVVARTFLYGLSHVETKGLNDFVKLLDDRLSGQQEQGLLTGMLTKRHATEAISE